MQEALGRQSPTWLFLTQCLSPEPAQDIASFTSPCSLASSLTHSHTFFLTVPKYCPGHSTVYECPLHPCGIWEAPHC